MSDNAARNQIIDLFVERLATVTGANGFSSNIGKSIHVWPILPMAESDVFPFVAVSDKVMRTGTTGAHFVNRTLEVEVVVGLKYGDRTAVYLRNAMNDVERVLGPAMRMQGKTEPVIIVAELMSTDIDFSIAPESVGMGQLNYMVEYRTHKFDSSQFISQ